jgi:NAD(P)-dependent dehydrogenase (short-subunit alcohol dehydrogenase family)
MTTTRLKDRRLLITGAANGIGAEVAKQCVREGARVALVDVDPAVTAVADELNAQAYVADVADPELVPGIVAAASEYLGGLDGLANIAGVQRDGNVMTTPVAVWHEVLGVNLTAAFLWARAALPVMLEHAPGSIVNIGSVASTHALPESAAYVTSKAGVLGLTRSLAVDFGRRGIRCNAILPGTVETQFFANYAERNPERARELMSRNFAGRFGVPADIAAAVIYLMSPESSFVNGASIPVDGGRTAAT